MSMTEPSRNYLLLLRDQLRDELRDASAQRDRRPEVVSTPYGPECAWVVYERHRMLGFVNAERTRLGVAPAPMAEVERVERLAAGHSDYADKYALYCAELILERGR